MDFELNSHLIEKGYVRDQEGHLIEGRKEIIKDLLSMSGRDALDKILNAENPKGLIQDMPYQDLFWLIKKIGEDDSIPILELASTEQWQYLLDLEIWERDRISLKIATAWLKRLLQADPERLLQWFTSEEGEPFAFFYLYKNIEVMIRPEEGEFDPKEGSFTLDGKFYINVLNPSYEETIKALLEELASENFTKYQALLIMLAGVIPAEIEEELFRLRNVRLAEHGFLPFDEALVVYSPIDPEVLEFEGPVDVYDITEDEEVRNLIPVSPFLHWQKDSLLTEAYSRIWDHIFIDRIRLEFSALCNQIISAEGTQITGFEDLVRTARKASGFLNIAIERLCGGEIISAELLLKNYPLLTLFRVGFGLVLRLKWEVEAWLKYSWFRARGLGFGFWGETWGRTLQGIMLKRPKLYCGFKEGEEFRDFERLSEVDGCRRIIKQTMAIDRLLKALEESNTVKEWKLGVFEPLFYVFLFNFWSRYLLKIEPSFEGISLEDARKFFRQLRSKKKKPPYNIMRRFRDNFIDFFMNYAQNWEREFQDILKETLSNVWNEFEEEYRWISEEDIDRRYSKFISIID
jgi:hypothetical protein